MEIITYMDNRKVNFSTQTKIVRHGKKQNHKRFSFPSKAINAYRYGASPSSIAFQEGRDAVIEKGHDISKNILRRETASMIVIAANSPPVSTKSPREISSVTISSIRRSSTPS